MGFLTFVLCILCYFCKFREYRIVNDVTLFCIFLIFSSQTREKLLFFPPPTFPPFHYLILQRHIVIRKAHFTQIFLTCNSIFDWKRYRDSYVNFYLHLKLDTHITCTTHKCLIQTNHLISPASIHLAISKL